MIDRDILIFKIVEKLSSKSKLNTEQKQSIITRVLNASEQEIETWNDMVNQQEKQDDKLIKKINLLHERKLKKIESSMKMALPSLGVRIVKESIANEDDLMKKLEKIFAD
jgi:hypothetical protein